MSKQHYTAIVMGVSPRDSSRHYEIGRFKQPNLSDLYDQVDSYWKALGWVGRSFVRYIDPDGKQLTHGQLIAALGSR